MLKYLQELLIVKNQTCHPQGRNLKIQIPPQNHLIPDTLKSDFPKTETFGKSWFHPQIFGRNDTMHSSDSFKDHSIYQLSLAYI